MKESLRNTVLTTSYWAILRSYFHPGCRGQRFCEGREDTRTLWGQFGEMHDPATIPLSSKGCHPPPFGSQLFCKGKAIQIACVAYTALGCLDRKSLSVVVRELKPSRVRLQGAA